MEHGRDIIILLIGLFIGAPLGMVITCILAMGKDAIEKPRRLTLYDGTDRA